MSVMQQGLLIAAIGMGLVFAVIIFLWGLMALMMRLTSREATATAEEDMMGETNELTRPAMQDAKGRRQAAAAAVAVALAIAKSKSSRLLVQREKNAGELSPWQAYHRTRQSENQNKRG